MTEKYLFITDTHYHMYTEFSKPDDEYGNDRFKEQMGVLKQALELAWDHDATLVHIGDVFHKRGSVDTKTFNHVFNMIESYPEVRVNILRGNHDSVNNSLYSDSSIVPFDAMDHVNAICEPLSSEFDTHNIIYLPYGNETDVMKAFINDNLKDNGKPNILLGHFGVNGAGSGTSSYKLGGEFTLEDIQADKFDYILLGHYHKRQMLSGNPNHIYCGALMQQSFSDEGYIPGAHLLTIEDDGTSSLEFIPIKSRMFYTVRADALPDNLDDIMANNFVRFIGDEGQIAALERVSDGVDTTNVRVMLEKEYKTNARLTTINSSSTPIEVTKSYAELHYPNSVNEALECLKLAQIQ